jgi:hypothetical protein
MHKDLRSFTLRKIGMSWALFERNRLIFLRRGKKDAMDDAQFYLECSAPARLVIHDKTKRTIIADVTSDSIGELGPDLVVPD